MTQTFQEFIHLISWIAFSKIVGCMYFKSSNNAHEVEVLHRQLDTLNYHWRVITVVHWSYVDELLDFVFWGEQRWQTLTSTSRYKQKQYQQEKLHFLSRTHTHTQQQTEAVYHIGPNFSSASMRSASTTASHRPLTWTTGLGEMWWESSPLSWNTPGCSRCRVRTSLHPVTFLKPERKWFYIWHVRKLAQLSRALKQLHWRWIRKWKCLGSWTASMSWLCFSYLVSRFVTQYFPLIRLSPG